MDVNRRAMLLGMGTAAIAAPASGCALTASGTAPAQAAPSLPDKASFSFAGTHLNSAYTHPLGKFAIDAGQAFLSAQAHDAARNWPVQNDRDLAVARYAALIGADPAEVAIVPSTLVGENLLGDALGLGPGAGVVTDALHYDASLAQYGERAKQGMPLAVIAPRGGMIDLDEMAAAITPETRLVAVSLVSSMTGYQHDLKALCDIAHAKGALVYADIIQAVGAVPFDVRQCGVDFCCAGTYKWLMGDFGTAFLYVKADVLDRLTRVQLGWRGLADYTSHVLPLDPPGPPEGSWELMDTTAGIFEVGTPNWGGLAIAAVSIDYIANIGVEAIDRHRRPLLDRLRNRLEPAGYRLLSPDTHQGPAMVFAMEGIRQRVGDTLKSEQVYTTLYRDRIRVSPSVFNTCADIDLLADILTA